MWIRHAQGVPRPFNHTFCRVLAKELQKLQIRGRNAQGAGKIEHVLNCRWENLLKRHVQPSRLFPCPFSPRLSLGRWSLPRIDGWNHSLTEFPNELKSSARPFVPGVPLERHTTADSFYLDNLQAQPGRGTRNFSEKQKSLSPFQGAFAARRSTLNFEERCKTNCERDVWDKKRNTVFLGKHTEILNKHSEKDHDNRAVAKNATRASDVPWRNSTFVTAFYIRGYCTNFSYRTAVLRIQRPLTC